jgi:hypothetical protein
MPPLSLSDAQMDAMRAAGPLQPDQRDVFLERVAARLRGREIGDGVIGRVCAEEQRNLLSAERCASGKYSRRSSRFAASLCDFRATWLDLALNPPASLNPPRL